MRTSDSWVLTLLILTLWAAPLRAVNASGQAQPSTAQSVMSVPPNELVQEVVQNELNARDVGHYMYRDRRQTPSGSKIKEMIETNAGVVARLIAVDDRPLTPEERAAENARLQSLVANPALQAKKRKEQEADEERVKRMFKELPNAFIYQYEGTEPGKWGELVRLKFHPNPNYDPPSRETSVFKAMDGEMWIDIGSKRLAKIQATLFRDVNFGWGILGHLDKGGHFFVAQSKIALGRWEATDMDIQFSGKALLFKTINLKQVEVLSEFRRVPDNLTLAQGIAMLNSNGVVAEKTGGPGQ